MAACKCAALTNMLTVCLCLFALAHAGLAMAQPVVVCRDGLNVTLAQRLAAIGATNIATEYPNGLALTLNSDADALPPRVLHPAFYGCYDWHSAVHTQWQMVRLIRTFPQESFVAELRRVLAEHLTVDKLNAEATYMTTKGREGFERPYGLAWLLQLVAELSAWNDTQGNEWRKALVPVEQASIKALMSWLPKLTHPIRIGEHSQTAFAFGLIMDYARLERNTELESLIVERSRTYYLGDRNCPLAFEPSGHDFLSPCLAEADLMRRVLSGNEYSSWLATAMPQLPRTPEDSTWLVPVKPSDYTDGKLAHFDGLNLSRAWMLYGIAAALDASDPRVLPLQMTGDRHADAGFAAVQRDMDYAGSHWLGSFAVYLGTCVGQ